MAHRAESGDIDAVLARAERAPASVGEPAQRGNQPAVVPFRLPDFGESAVADRTPDSDSMRGTQLDLRIELGRTQMALEDVLKLGAGSVVALDQLSGDPVDILAGGRLIARGQVVVLDDNFCVRVTELMAAEQAA